MSDECKECPYAKEIAQLQQGLKENEKQHKEFLDKINNQEIEIRLSEERFGNLMRVIEEVKGSVDRLIVTIDEIREKPAKRWDTVIACIITGVVGALIGRLMGLI